MDNSNGLLSLKWNNHTTTFTSVLSNLRDKSTYSDATIACDGKMFSVHKLVLSSCSEYFEKIFEHTDVHRPVIVLKDIMAMELDALLSYMYLGEVNVLQTELAGLIKAAECLRIKGLAVPDDPVPDSETRSSKRLQNKSDKFEGSDTSDSVGGGSKRQSSKTSSSGSPPSKRLRRTEEARTQNSEFNNRTKHSSPSSQRNSAPNSDKRINSESNFNSSRNNQHKDLSRSSSQEQVVMLDAPVKSETTSPKHEAQDCYGGGDGGLFPGSESGHHHHVLDDIMATVDSQGANDALVQGGVAEGDGSYSDQQYSREDDDQHNMVEDNKDYRAMTMDYDASGLSVPPHYACYTTGDLLPPPAAAAAALHINAFRPDEPASFINLSNMKTSSTSSSSSTSTSLHTKQQQQHHTSASSAAAAPYAKEFDCQYCSKRFAFRSYLDRHIKTHTGEKPYGCPHCPHRSARKDNLAGHMRCHGLYLCSQCSLTVTSKELLEEHVKAEHSK